MDAWTEAAQPQLPVSSVGTGTSACLSAEIAKQITFEPTKATAKSLVAEFPPPQVIPKEPAVQQVKLAAAPPSPGSAFCQPHAQALLSPVILYPCSALAGPTVQLGLEQKGYTVRRINTYTTAAALWPDAELVDRAKRADVVALASPSAVEVWVQRIGAHSKHMLVWYAFFFCME